MPRQIPDEAEVQTMVAEILQSRKYRELGLSDMTVRDLLLRELAQGRSRKEAVHAARQKLHNVVAPYLGDPDYLQAAHNLERAFQSGDLQQVRLVCMEIMQAHASTRERLPVLDEFYPRIFAITGKPKVLLDVACGLNPFAFPWMDLPTSVKYHAYDIHGPRIALINLFFSRLGLEPLGVVQDVLVEPPQVGGDIAFFFKEAHRFEQRQRGSSALLLDALQVRHLVVSLPATSLNRRFDLVDRQRQLVRDILGDRPWEVTEILIGDELVFCIDKGAYG